MPTDPIAIAYLRADLTRPNPKGSDRVNVSRKLLAGVLGELERLTALCKQHEETITALIPGSRDVLPTVAWADTQAGDQPKGEPMEAEQVTEMSPDEATAYQAALAGGPTIKHQGEALAKSAPPPAMPSDHVAVERQLNADIGGLERALEQVTRERDEARQQLEQCESVIRKNWHGSPLSGNLADMILQVVGACTRSVIDSQERLSECQSALEAERAAGTSIIEHTDEVAGLHRKIERMEQHIENYKKGHAAVTAQRDAAVERLRECESVLKDTLDSLLRFPVDSPWGSVPNMRQEISNVLYRPTLPANEAGGGDSEQPGGSRLESPSIQSGDRPNTSNKDATPAGDSSKRLKSPQGQRHHRVECECDICYPPAHELDRTVAALRSRLDAAGVVFYQYRCAFEDGVPSWPSSIVTELRAMAANGNAWAIAHLPVVESALSAARAWQGGGE